MLDHFKREDRVERLASEWQAIAAGPRERSLRLTRPRITQEVVGDVDSNLRTAVATDNIEAIPTPAANIKRRAMQVWSYKMVARHAARKNVAVAHKRFIWRLQAIQLL
jgi:hypothetical protein